MSLCYTASAGHINYIPSSSIMVAEAESPPTVNLASCLLVFRTLALREKVSSCSTMRSLMIGMSQGPDRSPGLPPAGKISEHVVRVKSAPSIV